MKIKVNGRVIEKWANLSVSLIYNSVASSFSFDIYWDPFDKDMRDIMLPGNYQDCVITADNGETLITGVFHSPAFKSNSVANLVNISGYSRTGVLQECEYKAVVATSEVGKLADYTTERSGKTLLQIVQEISDALGFGPVVDNTNGAANMQIVKTDIKEDDKDCVSYIADLTKDTKITLSHNAGGNIVLSVPKVTTPVYNFSGGMPGVQYDLSFNGQMMHNTITAIGNDGDATVLNPYVKQPALLWQASPDITAPLRVGQVPTSAPSLKPKYSPFTRPHVIVVNSANGTVLGAANQELAKELKAINIIIRMVGWTLNDKLVRPENIVTLLNAELYLFKAAKLFISRVDFDGDSRFETCVITCNIPECFVIPDDFNKTPPINIFTDKGNNLTFVSNEKHETFDIKDEPFGRKPVL